MTWQTHHASHGPDAHTHGRYVITFYLSLFLLFNFCFTLGFSVLPEFYNLYRNFSRIVRVALFPEGFPRSCSPICALLILDSYE